MSSDEETIISIISCKYGARCYQKNPQHLVKYKHPKKRDRSPDIEHSVKKQKNEDSSNESETIEQTQGSNLNNSITDKRQFIKDKFFIDMPEDFYLFWDLCKEINANKPKEAFKSVNLILVGPYDVLDESFKAISDDSEYLLHWRYYYDPPEFQTVLKGDDQTGFHIGYFRDSPEEIPVFVASNKANKDCIIVPMGGNIFAAVNSYLEEMLKKADPFKKMSINKLHKTLCNKAKELNMNLEKSTIEMRNRQRKTVCKSFHTAGIVVPYDRTTELGYRKLPVGEKELRKILDTISKISDVGAKAFAKLNPVLTAATIANDECDFGTALEFGINLFCFGSDCFNNTAAGILKTTYALLNRHAFADIVNVHFKNRKKGQPFVIKI